MNQAYSVWFREKGISLPGHWKQARSWSVATLIAILAATMLSCSSGTDETPNVTQSVPGIGSGGGGSGTNLPPVGNVSDPLFAEQWHLQNTGQGGGIPGEDSRVVGAWNLGRSGLGVRVAVVDDGLEIGHEDLAPNIVLGQSFNYLTNGSDPTPANSGPCSGAGERPIATAPPWRESLVRSATKPEGAGPPLMRPLSGITCWRQAYSVQTASKPTRCPAMQRRCGSRITVGALLTMEYSMRAALCGRPPFSMALRKAGAAKAPYTYGREAMEERAAMTIRITKDIPIFAA